MATLPQITLNFNRKIKLSNDGGLLSPDTGEFLFREFDEKLVFSFQIIFQLRLSNVFWNILQRIQTLKLE